MTPEQRLSKLKIELPNPPEPVGLYRPVIVVGSMALVSGHPPLRPDGSKVTGRVGETLSLAEGKEAARYTGLAILASLRRELGSLDRVKSVIRVFGMVNCTPGFVDHPAVINGCSEVFAEVFGKEAGVGVRCASGFTSLPANTAVEIEASFLIETDA